MAQHASTLSPRAEAARHDWASPLLGASPEIARIRRLISQIGPTDLTVLLQGESGTGKEVVARQLYAEGAAQVGQFVKINCAAIPSELLESELFGYEAGAFTGAVRARSGRFELAHGGTIFLDEIGEMKPALQAKLLHVLQDGEYTRLGGGASRSVQVRVIAATNIDIAAAVAAGDFRRDVFYRLAVVSINLPPLRHRLEDLPELLEHFLRKYAAEYNRNPPPLSTAAHDWLLAYDWPGNIRELENLVKRHVVTGDERLILSGLAAPPACPTAIPNLLPAASGGAPAEPPRTLAQIAHSAAADAERTAVLAALTATHWNRRLAAHRLGISYKGLQNKIKALIKTPLADDAPIMP